VDTLLTPLVMGISHDDDSALAKEDFSDIAEASPAQLRAMCRVGRPPLGAATRRLIAIRIGLYVLGVVRREARWRGVAISPSSTGCSRSMSNDGAAPEPGTPHGSRSLRNASNPGLWFHLGFNTPRPRRRKDMKCHGECSVSSRDTSSCVSVRSPPSRLLISGSKVRVVDRLPTN
jgi:hypothetical protein